MPVEGMLLRSTVQLRFRDGETKVASVQKVNCRTLHSLHTETASTTLAHRSVPEIATCRTRCDLSSECAKALRGMITFPSDMVYLDACPFVRATA
jgi:hypothetical protein